MIVQSTSIFGFPGLTNKTTTTTTPTAATTIYNRNSERDSGDSDRERVGDHQIENDNKDGTDKELLINKKRNKKNSIPITMMTPARTNTNKPDSNYPAHPPRPPIDHSKSTSSSRTIRPTSSFSSTSASSPAYPHPHPLSTPSGSANPADADADTVYSPGNHGVFIRRQSQQTSSCFSSDDSNSCGAASLVSPVDSAVSVGAQSVESRGTAGSGETEGTSYSGRNSDEKQYIEREQRCEGAGDSDRTETQGQRYADAETDTDTDTETNTDMAMSTTLDPALATSATAEPPFSSSSLDLPPLPPPPSFTTIKIKDLAHLSGLVKANLLTGHPTTLPTPSTTRYDISGMPVEDVITMVAGLLSKITATNDEHHDPAVAMRGGVGRSVLAFHGKNVPAISIANYLGRVHRYCPTTYEVFLSLLVYFDRMTERVNEEGDSEVGAAKMGTETETGTEVSTGETGTRKEDDRREEEDVDMDSESDIADDDDDEDDHGRHTKESSSGSTGGAASGGGYFVVDSYNIHRLIIAGVTCASKFFSDVFYTNSRYAKVGGLPLPELNHLELQFLILNDFRLFIPAEDLEAYATMLVEFYAREVVSVEVNNGEAVSGAAVVAVVAGTAKT